jgi:hypothetical protein
MPKAKKTGSADSAGDPNKLVRKQAGTYRTADDRFEVSEAGTGWFMVDSAQTDDLGQPRLLGPFATLKAVGDALPEARRTTLKPLARATPKGKAKPGKAAKSATPSPPPSWIDRLPKADAAALRRLIEALEREGIGDAEAVVRRDREGLDPEVATRLIEQRLQALVEELPKSERASGRRLVGRVAAILSTEGTKRSSALPAWTLVEVKPDEDPPPNRRIALRGD